ncbi:diguanylate cyclase domain-containing protein [Anabaena sp. PCC 7108]|uniref:diguanylate cyclase domain-containing protein n=1 Tax=Anabaena sp. PCC 7108 TaxID=163908 RepID=UPI000369F07A
MTYLIQVDVAIDIITSQQDSSYRTQAYMKTVPKIRTAVTQISFASLQLMELLPVGVCFLQHNGIVSFWNSCLEEWTNISREEILGKNIFSYFSHLNFQDYIEQLNQTLQAGKVTVFSPHVYPNFFHCLTKSLRFRSLQVTATPIITTENIGFDALLCVQDMTNSLDICHQYLVDQKLQPNFDITDCLQIEENLRQANSELRRLVNLDGLTEIANRRCFDAVINLEWQRLQREKMPLSLILCDLDYFKSYNDCYGHPAGDECLRQVAQAIARTCKRPADLVARYGGEEFAILLPNTPLEGAVNFAQQIQQQIANLCIPHNNSSVSNYVTLSMGIASIVPVPDYSPAYLIKNADISLYAAKNQGRNTYSYVAPLG